MLALKADAAKKFQFAGRSGKVYAVPCLQNLPIEVLQGLGTSTENDAAAAGQLCKQFRKLIEHYNPAFASEGASDLEILALVQALQKESSVDLGELLESRAY